MEKESGSREGILVCCPSEDVASTQEVREEREKKGIP